MTVVSDIERLVKMFAEVERYIELLIAETIQKNPKAQSLLFWKRRAQLIHSRLEALRKELLKQTPDTIKTSYSSGLAVVVGSSEVTQALRFGSGVHGRAMALLAAGMNRKLDAALTTVGRRVDDSFRKAGLRATAYHAASGTDVRRGAKQLENMLRRDGTRAFRDRAGRMWGLGPYSRMVIRTTTREAITQGTYNGMVDNGRELVQVSHHINSCSVCLPYDGNTYCLPNASAELQAKYPTLNEMPPFHPNCKHIIGPATAEFDRYEAELLAKYGAPT